MTRRTVAFWLTALLVCTVLGCDRFPGRPVEAESYRRPSGILDFASLYATNCSGCHGADGHLGPAPPLSDPVYLALVDRAQVTEIVARGVRGTGMPAFARSAGGTLTEDQVAALADGLFEQWAEPADLAGTRLPPYRASKGSPSRGVQVFARYCASCHGDDGRGGAHGSSVVDAHFLSLVSDQMLRRSVIVGRPDLGMPDWRQLGPSAMTPREISDVVAWMASKRRPTVDASRDGHPTSTTAQ